MTLAFQKVVVLRLYEPSYDRIPFMPYMQITKMQISISASLLFAPKMELCHPKV